MKLKRCLLALAFLSASLLPACSGKEEGKAMKSMDSYNNIHEAAEAGDLFAIENFMRDGQDPNMLDQYGMTALHYAAANGHIEVVEWLIVNGGAFMNAKNSQGATPLAVAMEYGQEEVAALLQEAGAKP